MKRIGKKHPLNILWKQLADLQETASSLEGEATKLEGVNIPKNGITREMRKVLRELNRNIHEVFAGMDAIQMDCEYLSEQVEAQIAKEEGRSNS